MSAALAFSAAARALARDCPAAYARVIDTIGPLSLRCKVGGEGFRVEVHGGLLQTEPLPACPDPDRLCAPAEVEIKLSPGCILNLLDGDFSADAAVRARALWLRGHPRALAALSRGARAFLHGATFSRGAERVLEDYRRSVQNARETM